MDHYIIFVGNQATVFGTIFIAYFNSLILSLVAYPVIRQNLFMTLLHLRWNSIVKSIQREWSRQGRLKGGGAMPPLVNEKKNTLVRIG